MKKLDKGQKKKPLLWRGFACSGIGRDRTVDTRIFSPVLYRLSYDSISEMRCKCTTVSDTMQYPDAVFLNKYFCVNVSDWQTEK